MNKKTPLCVNFFFMSKAFLLHEIIMIGDGKCNTDMVPQYYAHIQPTHRGTYIPGFMI